MEVVDTVVVFVGHEQNQVAFVDPVSLTHVLQHETETWVDTGEEQVSSEELLDYWKLVSSPYGEFERMYFYMLENDKFYVSEVLA